VKVLLVDDAAPVRARLGSMLAEVPGVSEVIEADGLGRALEALLARAPEIVVLDLHLRHESGMTLLPGAKRDFPVVLVIVMTNQPSERHRRLCLDLGADYFFDKSRDFEDVLRVVSRAAAPTRDFARSHP
jgi:two-component system OmpR family response regulator